MLTFADHLTVYRQAFTAQFFSEYRLPLKTREAKRLQALIEQVAQLAAERKSSAIATLWAQEADGVNATVKLAEAQAAELAGLLTSQSINLAQTSALTACPEILILAQAYAT